MQRGPKRKPPEDKIINKTYRASRDAPKHLAIKTDLPTMPANLTPAAQQIWASEITRVSKTGITELDTSLFADYCSLSAIISEDYKQGNLPKAAYLTELRLVRQLLGIGGASSRAMIGTLDDDKPSIIDQILNGE